MKEQKVTLGDAQWCQSEILAASVGDPLELEADYDDMGPNYGDPCGYTVHLADGSMVGRVGRRNALAQALGDGLEVLHASVQSIGERDGLATIRARIAIGIPGEQVAMSSAPQKQYPVGLVGESNYQVEICAAKVGSPVRIVHQTNNAHDERALAALVLGKFTIGYIPRSHWLQTAVHGEGKGCSASVKSIETAESGHRGVVLDVTLTSGPIERLKIEKGYPVEPGKVSLGETARHPDVVSTPDKKRGWFERLFGD